MFSPSFQNIRTVTLQLCLFLKYKGRHHDAGAHGLYPVYIRILDIHKPTHLYVIVSVGSPATVYSRGGGGGGGALCPLVYCY